MHRRVELDLLDLVGDFDRVDLAHPRCICDCADLHLEINLADVTVLSAARSHDELARREHRLNGAAGSLLGACEVCTTAHWARVE